MSARRIAVTTWEILFDKSAWERQYACGVTGVFRTCGAREEKFNGQCATFKHDLSLIESCRSVVTEAAVVASVW